MVWKIMFVHLFYQTGINLLDTKLWSLEFFLGSDESLAYWVLPIKFNNNDNNNNYNNENPIVNLSKQGIEISRSMYLNP